jgi:predicted rRNA methylase YqxC with S4 and FtsJ domains
MNHLFKKEYYINSNISNYNDYRFKKFDSLAKYLYKKFNLNNKNVLDYGCATGGLVSSLRSLGANAYGVDISPWAIQYGRKQYNLDSTILRTKRQMDIKQKYDLVIILDVLEHMTINEISNLLTKINTKTLLIRIPTSQIEGEDFYLDVSKNDKTHIQIHSHKWWIKLFKDHGFKFKPIVSKNIYNSTGVLAGILE